MKYNVYFFLLLFFSLFQLTAQQKLSERATVSVVTCGPGADMYSTYGHSAFRILDSSLKIDKIYNYGTFNFNAPNFYLNFAKGNLIYQLSTTRFVYFLQTYRSENRWVKAQVLDLNSDEVQLVYEFLENNAKPGNRSYRYDFFYDNCATKIEDVIKTVLKDKVTFPNNHINTYKTHRDLIADYTTDFKWGKFGIDLALGSVIDDEATKDDYKFLPDYIYLAFDKATITTENGSKPLVKSDTSILKEKPVAKASYSLVPTPFSGFFIIALLIVWMTFKNYKQHKRARWLDFTIYFITGSIGVVVLLLWFATKHTATYVNFNFLWAFAPNLLVAFYLLKPKLPVWVINYNRLLLLLLAAAIVLWVLKIQVFNIGLVPILLMLIIRYGFIIKFGKIS